MDKSINLFTFLCPPQGVRLRRRRIFYPRDFMATLRNIFISDIQAGFITKQKIKNVLRQQPAFVERCRVLKLSVQDVRGRIRSLIEKRRGEN